MLNEAIDALNCDNSDKIFVDATLGGGGHSGLILKKISQKGRLISFDVDIDAINASRERLCEYKNLTIIHDSYTNIRENLEKAEQPMLFINRYTNPYDFLRFCGKPFTLERFRVTMEAWKAAQTV